MRRLLLAVVPLLVAPDWAEVRVVDATTGRGVPLVELETTNAVRFVTDNHGRVAIQEPGWLGREIHFTVRGHGYDAPKDGFGVAGAKVTLDPAKPATIKLTRRYSAERIGRLTGEGRYRDSVLLGHVPAGKPDPGNVVGQDSVQAAIYRGKVYWLWGDTNRLSYPLGLYRMAGATTPFPPPAPPDFGFDYFTDRTGFARAMIPLPDRPQGVVWIEGLCVVPDAAGVEKMVAYYTRREGLVKELDHGLAVFDDATQTFQHVKLLPPGETWRFPHGHPIPFTDGGTKYLLCGKSVPNVRVPATLDAVLDPAKYEAFTCVGPDGKPDATTWRWQAERPPVESKTERQWVKDGKIPVEKARFCPAGDKPGEQIELHTGTVRWNAFRNKWLLIAGRAGGTDSYLGEVWMAEGPSPTGPFTAATKVATHDRQTFYNVCHHDFLDRDGGRAIHFEGTYTNQFSGNPHQTARYEYNQVLYRLELK